MTSMKEADHYDMHEGGRPLWHEWNNSTVYFLTTEHYTEEPHRRFQQMYTLAKI